MVLFEKCILVTQMPMIVSGNSSPSDGNSSEIDTTLFVQKHYLRTTDIESKFEEDSDKRKN